jgi:hypothetical protein
LNSPAGEFPFFPLSEAFGLVSDKTLLRLADSAFFSQKKGLLNEPPEGFEPSAC